MLAENDFPTVEDMLPFLLSLPARVEPGMVESDNDTPSIDVRLQVWPSGQWTMHSGDACYDADHAGFWGASCVTADDTTESLRETAKQLRDDAMEDAYQAGEVENA